jgi:hypothetical protein
VLLSYDPAIEINERVYAAIDESIDEVVNKAVGFALSEALNKSINVGTLHTRK